MPNINLTPRQRFQALEENLANHAHLVRRPDFEMACDTALLELQRRHADDTLPLPPDARFHQIAGAVEFVKILRALAEPAPQSQGVTSDNLDHHLT